MKKLFPVLLAAILFCSCRKKSDADLIVFNAHIYTADSLFSTAEAMAIHEGKIVMTGTDDEVLSAFETKQQMDAAGKFIYPGFIDGHSHFFRYGEGLQTVDLVGTKSWQEIVDRVKAFAAINNEGWILGRGWDQNDWTNKEFPDNTELNKLFPGRPVLLSRIDGHAAIVNQLALDSAKVTVATKVSGGEIAVKGTKLTGLLVDNAVDLVSHKIPAASIGQMNESLLDAQRNCFAVGLTSVVDCGLDYPMISVIDALQQSNKLKMRMYVMLSDDQKNFDYLFKNGAFKSDRLNVRSFKVYADGALGSRGACLLEPYADRPGKYGFLLNTKEHFADVAQKIADKGFQMCTHAIGDSANREVLNIYAKVLKGKNDRRWRIEHAQVLNPADLRLFGENSVVPSVQPTHATSDMYWAGDRLGNARLKGAYAYKQLLKENGWLVLGTDFPVENIDPLLTFYAAVVRKDAKGYPAGGFQPENALTRKEALLGMTIWAAKGSFEEKEKGSLEAGKFADFVVLDQDLMKVPSSKLLNTKVLKTYINGEKVYGK
ncbi:amidohydrolase [Hufsiella ginkgonis]|uniref:Amidohydrolase family protein n=1 Tax=Hufsiella ginkgonis TaxID=2695274 RepID=A0A7K1Y1D2_9SPHI|nr:amidohydrolase [Hufsiella ginkgonis]MXV16927.1 amidohydrolase family protein [Hufsiella ginkgonis]